MCQPPLVSRTERRIGECSELDRQGLRAERKSAFARQSEQLGCLRSEREIHTRVVKWKFPQQIGTAEPGGDFGDSIRLLSKEEQFLDDLVV